MIAAEKQLTRKMLHFLHEKGYALSYINSDGKLEYDKDKVINKVPDQFFTGNTPEIRFNQISLTKFSDILSVYECLIYNYPEKILKLLNELNLRIYKWVKGTGLEKYSKDYIFEKKNIKFADLPVQVALLMRSNGFTIKSSQGRKLDTEHILQDYWSQENLVVLNEGVKLVGFDFLSNKFKVLLKVDFSEGTSFYYKLRNRISLDEYLSYPKATEKIRNNTKAAQKAKENIEKNCREKLEKILKILQTNFGFRLEMDKNKQLQDFPLSLPYENLKKNKSENDQLSDPVITKTKEDIDLAIKEIGTYLREKVEPESNLDKKIEDILFEINKIQTEMQSLVDMNPESSVLKEVYKSLKITVQTYTEEAKNLGEKYEKIQNLLQEKDKEGIRRSLTNWQEKIKNCKKEGSLKDYFSEMADKKQEKLNKIEKLENTLVEISTQLAIIQETLDNLLLEMKNYALRLTDEEKMDIDQQTRKLQSMMQSLQEENKVKT